MTKITFMSQRSQRDFSLNFTDDAKIDEVKNQLLKVIEGEDSLITFSDGSTVVLIPKDTVLNSIIKIEKGDYGGK